MFQSISVSSFGRTNAFEDTLISQVFTTSSRKIRDNTYFQELQKGNHPNDPQRPGDFFMEFKSPDDIQFESWAADEYSLTCGWMTWAYCSLIVRYRNYNTALRLDLQAEYKGEKSDGLTYAEMEPIMKAMDTRFVEFLAQIGTPSP